MVVVLFRSFSWTRSTCWQLVYGSILTAGARDRDGESDGNGSQELGRCLLLRVLDETLAIWYSVYREGSGNQCNFDCGG